MSVQQIKEKADTEDVMLRLHDISKIYPGTVALDKVNMEVEKGEVHGIIGKNGAGKSTLVKIIAGMINPTEGEIIISGEKYSSFSRTGAINQRIAIVPQEPKVILDSTVAENLFMPDYRARGRLINWQNLYQEAEEVLNRAGLDINVRSRAGDLSLGEQQLLLVVKACYVEEARIIILDEASASLSQEDERLLYEIIRDRKEAGSTILFISHRIEELMEVCDRVTVLRDGKSITTEIIRNLDEESLSSLIVGGNSTLQVLKDKKRGFDPSKKETVLQVESLTHYGEFQDINFSLKRGEILGIAGLRGSGRSEIFRSIAGIEPVEKGTIYIKGDSQEINSPGEAFSHGLVYLPEDREKEGLIKMLSLRENLVLDSLHRLTHGLFIDGKREKKLAEELIEALQIKAASREQKVSSLSGGNKQKVLVAKILATEPDIFLLDEPTRGIDISAKESILRLIEEDLSQEAGIVLTSPGLEDLMLVCDRILVLYKGRFVAEFSREEFDEEKLYVAIQGGSNGQQEGGSQ